MDNDWTIDDFYLPLNSLMRVPIGTIILDTETDSEYVTMMLKGIFKAIHDSGYHEDSRGFAFHMCDKMLILYKTVPLFDVENHLSEN